MGAGGSAQRQSARLRDRATRLRDEAQARLEQAESLERSAAAWDKGWQGEQLVGAQLDLLQVDGWHVLHDVRWPGRPRANIDHIAVGPAGVLVVDAKNWSGELTVAGGRLRQNRSPRDREVTAVAEAGRAVAGQLDLPWALHVIPVLCATTPVSGGSQRLGETTVLGAQDLVTWVRHLPHQLTVSDVVSLAVRLTAVLPSANTPRSSAGARRVPARREKVGGGRRRSPVRQDERRPSWPRIPVSRFTLVAVAALAATTLYTHLADGETASSIGPAPANPANEAPTFASCRDLRQGFPNGISAPAAVNTGRAVRRVSVVDASVAGANSGLDKDADGLICERLVKKTTQGKTKSSSKKAARKP